MAAVRFANYEGLTGHGRTALRADALAIAAAGLRAADPAAELARSLRLDGDRLIVSGAPPAVVELTGRRLFLLGAGKATFGMAEVLDDLLGPRFTDAAIVVKRQGRRRALRCVEVLEAAHPVPDETSLAGGLRLQAVAAAARPGDLVIALVTGGSSALAVVPAADISLSEKIETNRLLLASGADIVAINSVRKHLSAIKGGRLGLACGCEIVNFTASDVVGDPLDCVTDLTVPDSSTWAAAQAVCDRFGSGTRYPSRSPRGCGAPTRARRRPKDARRPHLGHGRRGPHVRRRGRRSAGAGLRGRAARPGLAGRGARGGHGAGASPGRLRGPQLCRGRRRERRDAGRARDRRPRRTRS